MCKLKKSLYGLKQAPKQAKCQNTIVVNDGDACVYSKMFGNDCVIICLYVDDMLIFSANIDSINKTKEFVSSKFEMKDLREVDVILGVKAIKTENGYTLSQAHYVEKIFRKLDCFDVVPVKTPYDPNVHLVKNTGNGVSQGEYAQVI